MCNSEPIPPTMPKALFTKILSAATTLVEFSFNNTMHKGIDGKLRFLDVLVKKTDAKFFPSLYQKSIFTGQLTRWDSFGPQTENEPY